jgi:hypothetical protein
MARLANVMGDGVDRVLAAGASDMRMAKKLRDVRQGSRTGAMVEIPDDAGAELRALAHRFYVRLPPCAQARSVPP